MKGYYGRLLKINLDEHRFLSDSIPQILFESYLGGKGLSTHMLLQNNPPGIEALSSKNHIILSTGPLTGTAVWGSCRYGIYTKSPQTGFYSESYSGGTVAEYMARTGFDIIMINGASEIPVWIEISHEGAIFHDAMGLWGLDTFETEDRIKAWIRENRSGANNCGVMGIGPAGENMVSFAVVENDYWRSAGRTGAGAVFGFKKIKAIAFWGNARKKVSDPGLIKNFAKTIAIDAKNDKGVEAYKNMGTSMMVDIMNTVGAFPTRYWHKGKASHREAINASALHSRLDVVPHSCLKCFISCGRLSTVKQGRHRGLKIEGPEYETIYAFGGLCEIDNIEEIAYLNDLCDRLGMDTISAGNLAAFTIESVRMGKIDYPVDYGRTDQVAELLKDIASRKGIGDILAGGIRNAAKVWDMEDHAIHVKGLEPAGYDPRVLKGMGLAYGTSPRGACHLRSTFYKPELSGMIDPEQMTGKAAMFAEWEDRLIIFDSLILCRFYRDLYQWEDLSEMIKGTTGMDLDKEKMRQIAGNIINDARCFNIRESLTSDDDKLPRRFHNEILPETKKVISREQMKQLLKDYYQVRGWDEHGRPQV